MPFFGPFARFCSVRTEKVFFILIIRSAAREIVAIPAIGSPSGRIHLVSGSLNEYPVMIIVELEIEKSKSVLAFQIVAY